MVEYPIHYELGDDFEDCGQDTYSSPIIAKLYITLFVKGKIIVIMIPSVHSSTNASLNLYVVIYWHKNYSLNVKTAIADQNSFFSDTQNN